MERGIRVRYSTNYYPQGNGLAESTNKKLLKILKKIIATHHHNWNTTLFYYLWEDRVAPKDSIGNSPFFLVYGPEAILPPNMFFPSLQLAQSIQDENCLAMEKRINTLLKMDEDRERSK